LKIGLNIDGVSDIKTLVKKSVIMDKAGVDTIWLGEGPGHRHIYPILATVACKTSNIMIGTSIISVHMHKPFQLFQAFKLLKDTFGRRFIIGLGRGGEKHLEEIGKTNVKTLQLFERYLQIYREVFKLDLPVYLGAIGFNTIKKLGQEFDGVILNSLSPKIVKLVMERTRLKNRVLAIGPVSYLPGETGLNKFLRICAFIAAELPSRIALELNIVEQLQEIRKRYSEKDITGIKNMKDFLTDYFGLTGSIDDFEKRVIELKKIGVSEVIFSFPIADNNRKFNEFIKLIDRLREL